MTKVPNKFRVIPHLESVFYAILEDNGDWQIPAAAAEDTLQTDQESLFCLLNTFYVKETLLITELFSTVNVDPSAIPRTIHRD